LGYPTAPRYRPRRFCSSHTSNASSPQHHAFIRSAILRDDASYDVSAYPIVSFSHQGGAIRGYNNLPEHVKPFLIPLPPLSTRYPTPRLFGNALTFIGGFELGRDSWLLVNPRRFIMPEYRQVSLVVFLVLFFWLAVCKFRHTVQATEPPGPPDSQPVAPD
jgi:hypothetical protein